MAERKTVYLFIIIKYRYQTQAKETKQNETEKLDFKELFD